MRRKILVVEDDVELLLTALSGSFPRIHGMESGVNDFMTKPFNIRELLQRIVTLLHNLAIAGKAC